ncbi:MAG: hypothetical protein IMZ65_02895, partial [Planctomycetes bacterium]|nr:hypothetical protein [Planctomycetota bacterium]
MLVDGSKSVADLIVNNIGAEAPRVNTVRKVSPSQAENAGGADNPRRGGEPTGFPVATTDDAGQAAARQRAARRDSKTTRDGESAKPVPQQAPTGQTSGGKTQKKSTGSTDNLAIMAAVATNPNNNVAEAGKKGKFAQLVSQMTPVRANDVDTKGLATQPLMGAIPTQDAAKARTVVAKAAQTAPIIATTPTQVIKPQQVAPMQANAAAKTQDAAKAKSGKQVQVGNQRVETRQVAKPDAGTAVAVKPTATTVYTAQIAGATMVNAVATQTQQAGKPAKVPDGLNTGDTTSKGKAAGKGADSLKVAQASKTNAVVAARVEQAIQAGEIST